jgi:ParB family transcriptional regulator, chromosome partitioning protein
MATTYQKGKLYILNLDQLQADSNQPRKSMDEEALGELAASIRQHGVLEPILFRQDDEGNLFVVAGERRMAAAKMAELTTIPGIFVQGSYAEIALVENLLRQDLTAVEETEALGALMAEQNYTQEQLAGVIGKARSTINDILTLTRLPQEIRDACRGSRSVSRSTLIEIARKKQERAMITAWNKYKAKLEKESAGRIRQDSVQESPEDTLSWLTKVVKKFSSLDAFGWTEAQWEDFSQHLEALRETIGYLLNPPEEAEEGESVGESAS